MMSMTTEILYRDVERVNPFISDLKKSIDWDRFSNHIEKYIPKKKNNSGRPRFPISQMLRIVILQEIYNLSDDAAEAQINMNIAHKYFLDMDILDKSPDAKTIWLFKETLRKLHIEEELFNEFHKFLEQNGVELSKGAIVDASFIKVPVQRNSRKENEQIKNGITPESFLENKNKARQKDTDAKWTKKNSKSYYGYKNNIVCCQKTKIIDKYVVTSANVHDSQVLENILPSNASYILGDSAYRSEYISKILKENGLKNLINHRNYRNRHLTEKEKQSNRYKSKKRVRVEHIFAWFKTRMNRGLELRCIGIDRVKFRIGMRNTVYNMLRYISIYC